MKNTIYMITLLATLSWSFSALAQEVPEESANSGITEPVPAEVSSSKEANGNDLEPVDVQANEAVMQNEADPSVPQSYLIEEVQTDSSLESAAAPAPLDDAQPQTSLTQPDLIAHENSSPAVEESTVQTEGGSSQPVDSNDLTEETGWRSALSFYAGIGPAFDVLDSATGYSARLGLDVHWKYLGIGLEVTWNMIWATISTKRADHRDLSYRTTSSGLLLKAHGYIPATDSFVITLGAGIGLGKRDEIIFSNMDIREDDTSWLARLETGALWLFNNNLTLGVAMELNFDGYFTPTYELWWSDKKDNVSFGLIFTVSYQWVY